MDRYYTPSVSVSSVDDRRRIHHRNDAHADESHDLSGRCSYRKVVNHVAIPVDFDHLLELRVSNHGHWVGQRIGKLQD